MKLFICCMVLGVLSAQGQTNTNGWRAITNKIEAARYPANPPDKILRIAPNTPEFDEWAFNLMLKKVNEIRDKTGLKIPKLTVDNSSFYAKPTLKGLEGWISLRDRRYKYGWNFRDNGFEWFGDGNYAPQTFRYKDDESARLTKVKSKIDAKQAEKIARNYLHAIGLNEKDLQLVEPPEVNQYKFQESDGTIYPLPEFNVRWKEKSDPDGFPSLEIAISGITKQVAEFSLINRNAPKTPLPTNYFDMLGVKPPTNRLQNLSLQMLEPLHPVTNAPAKKDQP